MQVRDVAKAKTAQQAVDDLSKVNIGNKCIRVLKVLNKLLTVA
jgi:hypothetical protein